MDAVTSRFAGLLAALAATVGLIGCARHPAPPPSPTVLPDVSGHMALLIDHVGSYELTTEPRRDLGHPDARLAVSPSISCYATWHADAVGKLREPGDGTLVRLHATLVVDALRRPILAGYTLDWSRMGPSVVSLSPTEVPGVPPFPCPSGQQPRG